MIFVYDYCYYIWWLAHVHSLGRDRRDTPGDYLIKVCRSSCKAYANIGRMIGDGCIAALIVTGIDWPHQLPCCWRVCRFCTVVHKPEYSALL